MKQFYLLRAACITASFLSIIPPLTKVGAIPSIGILIAGLLYELYVRYHSEEKSIITRFFWELPLIGACYFLVRMGPRWLFNNDSAITIDDVVNSLQHTAFFVYAVYLGLSSKKNTQKNKY